MNKKDKERQRAKELGLIHEAIYGRSPENRFTSTHNLDFEIGDWAFSKDWQRFRVGTVTGLFGGDEDCFIILALDNSDPGNGHFTDVLEWFQHSCRRDAKDLKVIELWNKDLKRHLIEEQGFKAVEGTVDEVIKKVRDM